MQLVEALVEALTISVLAFSCVHVFEFAGEWRMRSREAGGRAGRRRRKGRGRSRRMAGRKGERKVLDEGWQIRSGGASGLRRQTQRRQPQGVWRRRAAGRGLAAAPGRSCLGGRPRHGERAPAAGDGGGQRGGGGGLGGKVAPAAGVWCRTGRGSGRRRGRCAWRAQVQARRSRRCCACGGCGCGRLWAPGEAAAEAASGRDAGEDGGRGGVCWSRVTIRAEAPALTAPLSPLLCLSVCLSLSLSVMPPHPTAPRPLPLQPSQSSKPRRRESGAAPPVRRLRRRS